MPDDSSFESGGITVTSVVPNHHVKFNPGCILVTPKGVDSRIISSEITLLQNRVGEIAPEDLAALLLTESEKRFAIAAYLHDGLTRGHHEGKILRIVYYPQAYSSSDVAGATIGIETALISAFGYEPEIKSPTTLVYHRGKPVISANGTGDNIDVTADEPSLAPLYTALKEILQPSLAQVNAQTLRRHTDPGSISFIVEPSKMFS